MNPGVFTVGSLENALFFLTICGPAPITGLLRERILQSYNLKVRG